MNRGRGGGASAVVVLVVATLALWCPTVALAASSPSPSLSSSHSLSQPSSQSSSQSSSSHPPTLDAASIDRYVRAYQEQNDLPGAVVAVTRGDEVVRAAGYGHTAAGQAMTACTPVPVASLSKSMTALAVMQLVEQGRVDLDEPVRRYLPEFTMADRRAAKITVRHLLNQTSGMADSAHPDLARPQAHTLKEAVADLRDARLAAEPGTEWNYHNPNYFVAARLVEVVSGQPFADRMAAQVFRPLGMAHTRSVDTTDDMPDHARGYVRAYGALFARSHPRWFTAGGHGVVTTADDLAQWLIAQHNRGVSAAGRHVVSARSVDITHTPPKGRDYAMGWSLSPAGEEPRQIRHNGELLTHNSVQTLLPDSGIGIAIVTNTGMLSGDDAAVMLDGLVDLAQGRSPSVQEPFSMKADYVLAALTVLALGLGTLGTVRARRWARRTARRPLWRVALRMLPCALPLVFLDQLTYLAGLFMNRRGTLGQLIYIWPALVIWSAAAALASTVVIVTRSLVVLMTRSRSRSRSRGRRAFGDAGDVGDVGDARGTDGRRARSGATGPGGGRV